jgi:hypothetical protein
MNCKTIPWACTHCNEQLQESDYVEQKGDLLVYRCKNCSNEMLFHVVSVPSAKRLDERCAIRIEWAKETPTVSELRALRKLIPRFREYPIAKLKNLMGTKSKVALGDCVKGEALDIQRRGRAIGLTIVIEGLATQLPVQKQCQQQNGGSLRVED